MERVAVAMSGGVDSAVAALLLKEQGYDVAGVTARMWAGDSQCSPSDGIRAAQQAAAQLGIQHHVLDLTEEFGRLIVEPFLDQYVSGRTPSPCPGCNAHIKFGAMMDRVLAMGMNRMATGHYARIRAAEGGKVRLVKGVDARKDQSYFLFALDQRQLAGIILPVGGLTKEQVRELARQRGLPQAARDESQDLCFVPSGDYAAFVAARRGGELKGGDMVDTSGRKLGRHDGIHRFTIGQRRGLGVAAGRPLYVVAIDPAANTVVLGDEKDAMRRRLTAARVNWIRGEPPRCAARLDVRIRYNHAGAQATVTALQDGSALVEFDAPQFAVTPGQCAVFYEKDEVLGGGWIENGSETG